MSWRDPRTGMWAEALELLQRADRLHRQFFHFASSSKGPNWEPPVDIFETENHLNIVVALPGVAAEQVEILVDGSVLAVVGERPLPEGARHGAIHRLELPYGRFERRIQLPRGRFEVEQRHLVNGCLLLTLRKLA